MSTIASLNTTVASLWLRDLLGAGPLPRRHWRTKTAHYRAVAELLERDAGRPIRWETVVDAVRPSGSRSTFYAVTGARATHPLLARYAGGSADHNQIAYCYQRSSAVDQLVDETKVWSYWPYREEWLSTVREVPTGDGGALAESLLAVVRQWAGKQPSLAAALDCAPPACAVEDLSLVHQGGLPALRAFTLLTATVSEAIGGPHKAAGGISAQVEMFFPLPRRPKPDELGLERTEPRYAAA